MLCAGSLPERRGTSGLGSVNTSLRGHGYALGLSDSPPTVLFAITQVTAGNYWVVQATSALVDNTPASQLARETQY
jgi:hypothetical protein